MRRSPGPCRSPSPRSSPRGPRSRSIRCRRSSYLVTGNGFGFQVFDVNANAIKQYLERPYRYLKANPSNPDGEGIVRRNLAFDTYFGVKAGGTARVARRARAERRRLRRRVEHDPLRAVTVGGVDTESFFVAPFGYPGNALVMLLKVTNTSSAAVPVTAYAIHNFKMGTAPNPDAPGADGETDRRGTARARDRDRPRRRRDGVRADRRRRRVDCNANAYNTVAAGGALTTQSPCSGTDQKNAFQKDLGTIAPGASRVVGRRRAVRRRRQRADRDAPRGTRSSQASAPDALYTDDPRRDRGVAQAARARPRRDRDRDLAPGRDRCCAWARSGAVQRLAAPPQHRHDPREPAARRLAHRLGARRDSTRSPRSRAAATATARRPRSTSSSTPTPAVPELPRERRRTGSRRSATTATARRRPTTPASRRRNIEIDGWGLFLWAARTYVDASGDIAWLAVDDEEGRHGLRRDQDRRRRAARSRTSRRAAWRSPTRRSGRSTGATASTSSTRRATAARGLCDMATLARRAGKTDDVARYKTLRARRPSTAMKTNFIDSQQRARRLARAARDAARTTATARRSRPINWSCSPPSDPIATATLGAMCYLQTPAGGYKRVEGSQDQYDTDEWILIDLRASRRVPPRRADRRRPTSCSTGSPAQASVELQPACPSSTTRARRRVRSARTRARSRWSATAPARTS